MFFRKIQLTPDEQAIKKGVRVRALIWAKLHIGTVTRRKYRTVYVQWDNSIVEDEMILGEIEII